MPLGSPVGAPAADRGSLGPGSRTGEAPAPNGEASHGGSAPIARLVSSLAVSGRPGVAGHPGGESSAMAHALPWRPMACLWRGSSARPSQTKVWRQLARRKRKPASSGYPGLSAFEFARSPDRRVVKAPTARRSRPWPYRGVASSGGALRFGPVNRSMILRGVGISSLPVAWAGAARHADDEALAG